MSAKSKVSIEEIEARALRGEDVSEFYGPATRKEGGEIRRAHVQRVNVDFTQEMLEELDGLSERLNVSRQAVIKMLLRTSLDQRALADQSIRDSRKTHGAA